MATMAWRVQYMDNSGKWRTHGKKRTRALARECARWLREKACYAYVHVEKVA